MAIDLATGFNIGSKDAIDERQVLTLEQMKNLDESIYPDNYFAICKDNGKLYIFNASNEIDEETGKFRVLSGGVIITNASLAELNDVDSTDVGDGKILVYDGATNKHKYVDSSITDEFVKMDSTTDAKYLSDLIDKSTVVNDNGVLKVKKLDGQEVTITEINYLKGLTMNVMDLVNAFSNGWVKVWETPVNTYSDLETLDRSTFIDEISYIVYVLIDETHSNAKTTYLCTKTSTTFFGNADNQRNFITNPIDLANEVTGKLGTSNIDVDNLWTLLTINDTYKTLTTNNEIFGTHGAKAMYDELTTAIGKKANTSDIHELADITRLTDFDEAIPEKGKNKIYYVNKTIGNYTCGQWRVESMYYDVSGLGQYRGAQIATSINGVDVIMLMRVYHSDDNHVVRWSAWKEFATRDTLKSLKYSTVADVGVTTMDKLKYSTVEDVGVTTITPVNSAITGNIEYIVKNGICYVSMKNLMSTISSTNLLISTTMPKPSINCTASSVNASGDIAKIYINKNTTNLCGDFYTKNAKNDCSFSYPVAE